MTRTTDKFNRSAETTIALIQKDVAYIREGFDEFRREVREGYVTKSDFKPVKILVYGATGMMLTAVVGALVALVV